jgi:uncharacterized protein (DUF433 family)
MARDYVERRDRNYYISGSRVSLDSIVYAYLRGESPEDIAASFPVLELTSIYGALTFYLENRQEIDLYLEQGQAEFARLREESRRRSPALYAKLDAAKESVLRRR